MPFAPGHKKGTLVSVRVAIAAADGLFVGDIGAVGGAHTLGSSSFHLAHLRRATLDPITVLCGHTVINSVK